MSASADRQLFQLYMELGDAQAHRQRPQEAADAYALALYYARRCGDDFSVQRCRELVLARSPNHVAGQPISAPLFFAQLLMRYPADEAAQTLAELRGGGVAAPPEPPVAYALDIDRRGEAPIGDSARPPFPGAASIDLESHHVFDLGGPTPAPRDDFHLRDAGLLDNQPAPRRRTRDAALDVASYLAIAVGVGGGVFFATQLYPTLRNIDFGALRSAPAGAMSIETPMPDQPSKPDAPKKKEDPQPAPPALAESPSPSLPPDRTPEAAPLVATAPDPGVPAKLPAPPLPPPVLAVETPAGKSAPPRAVAGAAPPVVPPVASWENASKDRLPPVDPAERAAAPKKRKPIRMAAKSVLNQPGTVRANTPPETTPRGLAPVDEALRLGARPDDAKPAAK